MSWPDCFFFFPTQFYVDLFYNLSASFQLILSQDCSTSRWIFLCVCGGRWVSCSPNSLSWSFSTFTAGQECLRSLCFKRIISLCFFPFFNFNCTNPYIEWIVIGRTDAETEIPRLWPPDVKNWLIWKDPDAWKDWRQEEKGTTEDEMVGWHHQLNGHEFE